MESEHFEISDKMDDLAEEVICEHEELHWIRQSDVRIGYVSSDKAKQSKGREVYGACMKVKEIYQLYTPYDFLIIFYAPNVEGLDREQLKILMFHELLHVGVDSDGEPKIVPHDIEDFSLILERYGLGWGHKKESE